MRQRAQSYILQFGFPVGSRAIALTTLPPSAGLCNGSCQVAIQHRRIDRPTLQLREVAPPPRFHCRGDLALSGDRQHF
ncbi:unnamed protein product [Protopolystoma xenopodis]|uniref:Uncharacterized protein n=1 Tax=Protopolystoma xenopodis TaxID=117903 RepID=A0A448WV83_9PLAT|nr:unnamed protein product [Protopolystoma xenopodis]